MRFFILLFCSSLTLYSQEISLLPEPTEMELKTGEAFRLHKNSRLLYSDSKLKNEVKYLKNRIQSATGFKFSEKKSIKKAKKGDVVLKLQNGKGVIGSYRLEVKEGVVEISANTTTGVFYGIQSLQQLFPAQMYASKIQEKEDWSFPAVTIEDAPVFEWRGMHLDVARNFRSVFYVKRFIDLMAMHKLNVFHWHLTEDQGWRIEIKKYPKLTEIGAWRDSTLIGHMRDKPHQFKQGRTGGFYTQKEIKEVVQYAQQRHITIVPEIEMPGHAQAAIAAYPELGNTGVSPGIRPMWGISKEIYNPEETTIAFLKDVLDEVLALFPSTYIHIGGDEAKKDQWESSKRAQELLKERGLHDMHEMQSWFISQIDTYLTAKGRKLIGWDEILEGGLADGAAVMSWRGDKGGIKAAKAGHKAVMATNKYTYFDKYQSKNKENEPLSIGGLVTLETVYHFQPIPKELTANEAKNIMGAQGQLWSEYIVSDSHMDYMAFPRVCALADVVWSNKESRNYKEFLTSLEQHLHRLAILNINYRMPDEFKKK